MMFLFKSKRYKYNNYAIGKSIINAIKKYLIIINPL